MSKVMQNLVVLMDQSQQKAYENSLKAGNMIFNRFCIDEDAAFELSGVNNLKKLPEERKIGGFMFEKVKVIGKEYSFLRSYFILGILT